MSEIDFTADEFKGGSPSGSNPKDDLAKSQDRAPLDYLEPAGDEATARALKFGADKYGRRNFADPNTPIKATVYIGAMRRHIAAYLMNEDDAPDSGISHLGHIAASCQILLAAAEAGTLIDDRHGREDWQHYA